MVVFKLVHTICKKIHNRRFALEILLVCDGRFPNLVKYKGHLVVEVVQDSGQGLMLL